MARLTVNVPVDAPGYSTIPAAVVGSMTAQLAQKSDYVSGEISGLKAPPKYCTAKTIVETGVTVQSGLTYIFTPTKFTSSGFVWELAVTNNEYWPGPGPINLLINYVWGP